MSIENIKEFTESQGIFGEPLEYKSLLINPILMKDANDFEENYGVLDIDKNKLGVEFIPMSYLFFLLDFMKVDNSVIKSFLWVLEKTLHIAYNKELLLEEFPQGELLMSKNDEKDIYIINGWEVAFEVIGKKATLFIGETKLSSTDFNEFRKIILYQNLLNYDDTIISDDVKRVVTQYYELKNKGIQSPSLEDKMLAIIASSSETRESIKTMPYRQFEKLFDVIKDKTEYIATKPLIPHLKNPDIEHWLYKRKKNKFEGIFSNAADVGKAVVN